MRVFEPRHAASLRLRHRLAVAIRPDADQHHRRRQDHAHGQPVGAEEVAELLVGLAEEFDEDARQAVAADEGAADEARRLQRARRGEDAQHEEQHHAFEQGLVELARMAGERPAIGELDRPGHVGRPAPEFAVDEIGDAHQDSPTGTPAATTSNSDHVRMPRLMENSVMARMTPSRPPWNDMPPCQTAKMSSGCAVYTGRS